MAMLEGSFAQLFRAVERVRMQLETSDTALHPYLTQELLSLQELGAQIIDQWMTLDEHIQDLVDTYHLDIHPIPTSYVMSSSAKSDSGFSATGSQNRTDGFVTAVEPALTPAELEPSANETTGLVAAVFSWSDETVAQFRKGLAFFDLLMWNQAYTALEQVLTETDAPIIHLYLSAVLAAQGRTAESRIHLKHVRNQTNDRVMTAAVLEVDAQNCLHEGQSTEAAMCFQSIVEFLPESMDARYNLGLSRFMSGSLDEAVEALRVVTAADGEDSEAWSLLTHALYRKGESENALEACQQGLSFRPMNTNLLLWKSRLLQRSGEVSASRRIADSLAQSHPDNVEIVTWGSWLHLVEGHHASAISRLKRFLTLQPNHPVALLQLGIVYLLENSLDEAERLLTGAIAFSDDRSLLWLALGAVHSARQDASTAQKLSLRAIHDPRRPVRRLALYRYACSLNDEARYKEAEKYFRAAHTLGKPNAAILKGLAECAQHLGRLSEAQLRRNQAAALAEQSS